jgi:hypothetical protein
MKKIFLTLILFSQMSFAEQLEVDYSRFYSHLKKIDKEELNALQFSFGFKKAGETWLCDINQASIVTPKITMPLTINKFNRFTLPIEKALKLANAYVVIDLQQAANQCDMSVQLETKDEFLKLSYSQADLLKLSTQYKQFFTDMGSFLSFMMPSSHGLKFTFEEPPLMEVLPKDFKLHDKEIDINDKAIEQAKTGLILSIKPMRINALLSE